MKTIYTWGDSHVSMFDETYRDESWAPKPEGERKVVFHERSHCAVYTAYNIENRLDELRSHLSKIDYKEQDEIWFMFGEIDVRFHIFYHHQRLKMPLDKMIDLVTKKYTTSVNLLRQEGYNAFIVSVVPPQRSPGPHLYDPVYATKELDGSNAYIRGEGNTLKDRIYITEEFNRQVEIKCKELSIGFRNIHPLIVDPETRCNILWMTRDGMHYNYLGDILIKAFHLDEGV
uniref:Putative structural protein n=1 Tax=viral metagenome TaxID=1070528 RepID=A0A6M3L500_9ZZZZ